MSEAGIQKPSQREIVALSYDLLKEIDKSEADIEKVKELVAKGADINFQNSNHQTPLILAVLKRHFAITEFLLSHEHLDVDQTHMSGANALLYSIFQMGVQDITLKIIARAENLNQTTKTSNTALILSIEHGFFDAAAALVKKGAALNLQDSDGYTALMWAVKLGRLDLVTLMVEKGADLFIKTRTGQTAGDIARTTAFHPITVFLEKKEKEALFLQQEAERLLQEKIARFKKASPLKRDMKKSVVMQVKKTPRP